MKHLSQILCPVDFSNPSYQAIRQASFLAQLYQADLTLLHVVEVPVTQGVDFGNDFQSQMIVERATEQARDTLRQAKRDLVPYAVTCKSSVRYGHAGHEIIEESKTLKPDLIVLAMDQGSHADKTYQEIVDSVPCPILYFRSSQQKGEGHLGFKKILIPLNLDAKIPIDIGTMLTYMDDYFSIMNPEVTLLSVLDPGSTDQVIQERKEEIAAYAENFVGKGASKVFVKLIKDGDPAHEITRIATQENCDMIMMYTHVIHDKRDEPGPVTHKIIQVAETSVLAVRK